MKRMELNGKRRTSNTNAFKGLPTESAESISRFLHKKFLLFHFISQLRLLVLNLPWMWSESVYFILFSYFWVAPCYCSMLQFTALILNWNEINIRNNITYFQRQSHRHKKLSNRMPTSAAECTMNSGSSFSYWKWQKGRSAWMWLYYT